MGSGSVTWTVCSDGNRPDLGPLLEATPLTFEDFKIPDATNLPPGFFDKMFPSVIGMGARLDRCPSDPRATFHGTGTTRKITFDDSTNRDPDWIVKRCF